MPSIFLLVLSNEQPSKHDRPIAIWDRENSGFRPDDAKSHRLFQKQNPSTRSTATPRAPNLTPSQALCLAPSRELARQIMSVVVAMGKFTQIQTEYAIKDNLPKDAKHITAHIVVGTPGTMTDLMRRKVIDVSEVKVFVLDEADNMLDQDGLGDQTLRVKK
jgi:superfamily II DNA/RNA helicase